MRWFPSVLAYLLVLGLLVFSVGRGIEFPHAQAQERPRVVLLRGEIDDDVAAAVIHDLDAAPEGPLELRIDSPGGDIMDGEAILEAMYEHSGPITCVDTGLAASMAGIILESSACSRRVMNPMALFHVHLPSGSTQGNVVQMQAQAAELRAFRDAMFEELAARMGVTAAEALMIHVDAGESVFFTARQALSQGLVDAVR